MTLLLLTISSQTLAFAQEPRDSQRRHWRWTGPGQALALQSTLPPARLGYAVLRLKPSTIALLPLTSHYAAIPGTTDLQLALVPIDHMQQLDALAPLAHADAGACGSLEFMPLDYRLADTIEFAKPHYPALAHFSELPPLLAEISLERIDAAIKQVLTLPSRFHSDTEGMKAGASIAELWRAQLKSAQRWSIEEITHTRTLQKSVVARLPGTSSETVILGAHLDSVARSGGQISANAPGADDDASGLAILTEILHLIELKQLSFTRTIELHAYAAEEVGLIGSRELALRYRQEQKRIAGMMQFDMAYYSEGSNAGVIHLLEDYSSRDLRRSAMEWIRRYIGPYYRLGRLPSGSASDHKSWWEQGYPTIFPFENPLAYNPHIHSELDQIDKFDNGLLIQRITQLALTFISYQAGLSLLESSYQTQAPQLLPRSLPRDLYLANQREGEGAESFAFWVSAPAAAKTLEFCSIQGAEELHCTGERLILDESSPVEDRRVFTSDERFALAAGQQWRVMAYDKDDQAIAWRQITFEPE